MATILIPPVAEPGHMTWFYRPYCLLHIRTAVHFRSKLIGNKNREFYVYFTALLQY